MRRSKEAVGRRALPGLVVGAAILLAASPTLAWEGAAGPQAPEPDAKNSVTASSEASGAITLNIGYFDRAAVPAEVMRSMQREVERLLGGLGVAVASLDAADLDDNQNMPSGTLLNVVVWEQIPRAWDVPRNTLGVCPDSGKLPRNVYVFEPTILREIGLASKGIDAMRAEDVGRAFGRVVAHEVIHAFATFAGEHRHRGNGLMGHGLGKDTLLRPDIGIDERSGSAFREGLVKAAEDGGSAMP